MVDRDALVEPEGTAGEVLESGAWLDVDGMGAWRPLDRPAVAHRALGIARHEKDQELLAIEVRQALDELGKIAGAVYTYDILDRIFSRFCIGK